MRKNSLILIALICFAVILTLVVKQARIDSGAVQNERAALPSNGQVIGQIMSRTADVENNPQTAQCASSVYYASYPPKCLSKDGKLIQVKSSSADVKVNDGK